MSDDPYSRLYWRFADEYPEVYASDAALALWCRLLRLADMAWPSAATLPYGTRRAPLAMLQAPGLVLMVTTTTYKVRGMDKERSRRQDSAKTAAAHRWGNAERNADGNAGRIADRNAETMPSRAEHSQDEKSRAEQMDRDAAVALYERMGRFPSKGISQWLDRLAGTHGEGRLTRAIDEMQLDGVGSPGDYLKVVEDRLRAEDRAAEKAEAADEKRRLADKRATPPPVPIRDTPEFRRHLAELTAMKPGEAPS